MKKYFFKLKYIISIKIVFAAISIVGIAMSPYIIKMLIDYDFSKGAKGIIVFIAMYFGASVLAISAEYISQLHAWKLNKGFNLLIKEDVFKSIINLSYINFSEEKLSSYLSILQNEVNVVEEHYVESMVAIIQTAIQVIIYAAFLFILDIRIAILIILFSIIGLFLPNVTSKTLSVRRGIHLNSMALYLDKVKDLLEGFKNINYATRKNILNEHNSVMEKTEDKLLNYGKFSTFTNVFNGSFMYLMNVSVFAYIAILLIKSKITPGTAIASLSYVESFAFPLRYIMEEISHIKSAKSAKDKLLHFINTESPSENNIITFNKSIKFENVNLSFENFKLHNFNYEFEKDKKYAIIGHSGSGKSTVLNLLMKYMKSENGKILIDDKEIEQINSSYIMGCINQMEHIFSDSFINNVTVYNSYEATKLNEIIDYFNNEKIYFISEKDNCSQLSGGEKQLLQIVKLMLINCSILLMDEPFSALDVNNKIKMQDLVYNIKEKTFIVITHDLSYETLKYFDKILIMGNGTLLREGPVDEIINSKEYKALSRNINS